MSEPALPEDVSRWPDDPYSLLGVAPGVGPRDLKRAYTRLIRAYKPEQFPEQFRRIRAAYEHVLRFAELAESFGAGLVVPEPLSAPRASRADAEAPPPVGEPAVDDEIGALWEQAVAGATPAVYRGLIDQYRQRPGRLELPLRLYWLLALDPALDPGREPAAWLAEALAGSGLTGPAVELYRQELEERPGAALHAGQGLLALDVPAARIAEVAEWRARAAGRLWHWDWLYADREVLHERLRPFDEGGWVNWHFAACDAAAWSDEPAAVALLAECRAEIDQHGHLAIRDADPFDRLDYLLTVATAWRAARTELPARLAELWPLTWARPFAQWRSALVAVLAAVAADPRGWLRHFDALQRLGPAAVPQFGWMLSQYQDRLEEAPGPPYPPEVLAALAAEFCEAEAPATYSTLRPKLLQLCLRESVGPEWLALVMPPVLLRGMEGNTLPEALEHDWPLRCVCWASRLFWA